MATRHCAFPYKSIATAKPLHSQWHPPFWIIHIALLSYIAETYTLSHPRRWYSILLIESCCQYQLWAESDSRTLPAGAWAMTHTWLLGEARLGIYGELRAFSCGSQSVRHQSSLCPCGGASSFSPPFFSQVSFYLTSTMKMLADFNKGSFIAHVNVHPFPFLHLSCSPLIDAFFLQR